MFTRILFGILGMVFLAMLTAANDPVKPQKEAEPKAPTPAKLPDLTMQCQFGAISQFGTHIEINGSVWKAVGSLREDGKVQVTWIRPGETEAMPGVYVVTPLGQWVGHFGYASRSWIDDKGELAGTRNPEILHKVEPSTPQID